MTKLGRAYDQTTKSRHILVTSLVSILALLLAMKSDHLDMFKPEKFIQNNQIRTYNSISPDLPFSNNANLLT